MIGYIEIHSNPIAKREERNAREGRCRMYARNKPVTCHVTARRTSERAHTRALKYSPRCAAGFAARQLDPDSFCCSRARFEASPIDRPENPRRSFPEYESALDVAYSRIEGRWIGRALNGIRAPNRRPTCALSVPRRKLAVMRNSNIYFACFAGFLSDYLYGPAHEEDQCRSRA